jgi:ketosteroid isomerase-like protein
MTREDSAKMALSALQRFSDAWTRGDVSELMSFMTEDCMYAASVGPEPGQTFYGRRDVERGFVEMLRYDAGRERLSGPAFVLDNVAVAEWAFRERRPDGTIVLIRGCDIFEFAGTRIRKKDAFRKVFELALPADSSLSSKKIEGNRSRR